MIVEVKNEKKANLVYPELSYKIVGILFEVYNELGYGYQEKYYQRAIVLALKNNNIAYKEQVSIPLKFKSRTIGRYFLDFLIENKLVLEIKKGDNFLRSNIEQAFAYLKAFDLKLGIIANFTKSGVRFKRILNIESYQSTNKKDPTNLLIGTNNTNN